MGVFSSDALNGAPAAVPIRDTAGNPAKAMVMVAVDPSGAPIGTTVYTLAKNDAIAANSGAPSVVIARRDIFTWDAQWTGDGTLALQYRASDGVTWRTAATLAAPGTYQGDIRIGAGSEVRLRNQNAAGGTAFTAVYSGLS